MWTPSIVPTRLMLILVLMTAACGSGDEPAWQGSVEVVDGVPVVRNPSEPLHPAGTVGLTAVWSQSGPAEGAIWEDPRDVAVDSAVLILDRLARRVYRLDPNTGALAGTFGREGSGPGELQTPSDLVVIDGRPLVLDQRELEQFGPDGEHRAAVRLNAILVGLYSLGGDSVVATAAGTDALLNLVTQDGLRAVPVPEPRARINAHFDDCGRFGTVDTLIARLSCVRPFFQLFDRHGTAVREVLIEGKVEERSEAELEEHLADVRGTLAETGQPAAAIDAFVESQRAAQRFRRAWRQVAYDPATGILALLEQESEDFGGGPATLHIFDSEGAYLAAVSRSESWWDFAFLDGDIVALVRAPDTGLVTAVRYRLTGLDL